MDIKYIILIILIVFLVYFLKKNKDLYEKMSEDLSPGISIIENEIIKDNYDTYEKYKKIRNKLGHPIGYRETDNTNIDTVGFCPLGKYFKGNIPKTLQGSDLDKCKNCLECPLGHHIIGGCLGDTNTICKRGKAPYDAFISAHSLEGPFHNFVPKHKHKYGYYKDENKVKYHLSQYDHKHIK